MHQAEQLPLFEDERKKLYATQAMDKLNERYEAVAAILEGICLGRKVQVSHVIPPPSWRPESLKSIDVK